MQNEKLRLYIKELKNFLELAKELGDISSADISSLATFSFEKLKNNDKYESYRVYSSNKDNDSARLARIIYYILWGNHSECGLQNLNDAEYQGGSFDCGEDKYGGDTLINKSYEIEGDKTIGNFWILPKGRANNQTLNQYRNKGSRFYEDLYKFLDVVKKMYNKENVDDNTWQELFDNEKNNLFFIGKSEGEEGFNKFVEFFMLDGWEELAGENKEKMENFVKQRSEKICTELEKIFKKYADEERN